MCLRCYPILRLGWGTAAHALKVLPNFTTGRGRRRRRRRRRRNIFQSIQAPSSTHPGTTDPVRANPSLRYIYIYIYSPKGSQGSSKNSYLCFLVPRVQLVSFLKKVLSNFCWNMTSDRLDNNNVTTIIFACLSTKTYVGWGNRKVLLAFAGRKWDSLW